MLTKQQSDTVQLSPWWRRSVALVFVVGMIGLIFMSVQAYRHAPPIPDKVVDSEGAVIFDGRTIEAGSGGFFKIRPDAKWLHLGARLLPGA